MKRSHNRLLYVAEHKRMTAGEFGRYLTEQSSKYENQLTAERERRERAERWLGELLAVIHCDGGHYQAEHGIEQATKDAIEKRNQLIARIDVLENQLLSALAAIEKKDEALDHLIIALQKSGYQIHEDDIRALNLKPDLFLLHEHDDELLAPYQQAIQEANWLLSGYVDAGGGTKALLEWAEANFTNKENRTKWLEQHDAEVRKPLVDALGNAKRRLQRYGETTFAIDDALAKVKEGK